MNVTNGNGEHPGGVTVGASPRTYGPAAVALLTIALTTWPIAFNFGAYDAVFYQDVFQVVIVSTVGFALAIIQPPYRGPTLWLTRVALAAPLCWMGLAAVLFDSLGAATSDNDAFLTCDDFKIAGSDQPADCAQN